MRQFGNIKTVGNGFQIEHRRSARDKDYISHPGSLKGCIVRMRSRIDDRQFAAFRPGSFEHLRQAAGMG